MSTAPSEVTTSNLALAAFLISKHGAVLLETLAHQRDFGIQIEFRIYLKSGDFEKIKNDFESGSALPYRLYAETYRSLKGILIHATKEKERENVKERKESLRRGGVL
jgi:hypothetical protein